MLKRNYVEKEFGGVAEEYSASETRCSDGVWLVAEEGEACTSTCEEILQTHGLGVVESSGRGEKTGRRRSSFSFSGKEGEALFQRQQRDKNSLGCKVVLPSLTVFFFSLVLLFSSQTSPATWQVSILEAKVKSDVDKLAIYIDLYNSDMTLIAQTKQECEMWTAALKKAANMVRYPPTKLLKATLANAKSKLPRRRPLPTVCRHHPPKKENSFLDRFLSRREVFLAHPSCCLCFYLCLPLSFPFFCCPFVPSQKPQEYADMAGQISAFVYVNQTYGGEEEDDDDLGGRRSLQLRRPPPTKT